jgi:hypothetical protein
MVRQYGIRWLDAASFASRWEPVCAVGPTQEDSWLWRTYAVCGTITSRFDPKHMAACLGETVGLAVQPSASGRRVESERFERTGVNRPAGLARRALASTVREHESLTNVPGCGSRKRWPWRTTSVIWNRTDQCDAVAEILWIPERADPPIPSVHNGIDSVRPGCAAAEPRLTTPGTADPDG